MADTEDYSEEATPSAHASSHEDEGTDEISLAGLAGEPLELTTHAALATVHQDAPDLILTHKGDADAHHAKYTDTDAEAVADTQIGIHAALATVHQDAPDLILTHKGDASAHHAKYTDAEARALFSPLAIPTSAFHPQLDTYDWTNTGNTLNNRTSLTRQDFNAPLYFPDGVTLTTLTLHAYRDDASSALGIYLYRLANDAGFTEIASVIAGWTNGYGSKSDTSINHATIDNVNYHYALQARITPNDSVNDVKIYAVKIYFTG